MNKTIFIAFAIEDENLRDFLYGQKENERTPFEFIDMSVKEPYDSGWKEKVRTRIKRSHGVIAILTPNSYSSAGQKWEIECAQEERIPILGIYPESKSSKVYLERIDLRNKKLWKWDNIQNFIDSLQI